MDTGAVQQVRSFNRIVAERIGALDDRFLKRDRPIGEARLLWEIGSQGAEVRELRSRLGIDSGYFSRVLRSLEKQRLIRTRVVPEDRRLRRIFLTRAGLAERAELERRSDELATNILESLSDQQRSVLTAAMRQVEQLLRASMITFGVEPPTTPDARWCFDQYTAELNSRFDGGFDPGMSRSAHPEELTPPSGLLILGRLQGRPVGCGALKFHKKEPAELKRMWIAESVRGLGVGRRCWLSWNGTLAKQVSRSFVWRPTGPCMRRSISINALDMSKSRHLMSNRTHITGSKNNWSVLSQ